ncbi:rho guanine nucleotide exchange factor 10-like protein isoform X2 [Brevipalpus obovatus]|uniref:rho guanine nucleotide exchange factor 10-like protein isoform X2 n=1 Tax=Brevipalpus obovatus TaxID=246614 RepID=UPI003D9EE986
MSNADMMENKGCSSGQATQIPPPVSFANPLLDIEPDTRSSDSLPRSFQQHKKPSFQKTSSSSKGIYQKSLSILANGVSPLLRKKHSPHNITSGHTTIHHHHTNTIANPNHLLLHQLNQQQQHYTLQHQHYQHQFRDPANNLVRLSPNIGHPIPISQATSPTSYNHHPGIINLCAPGNQQPQQYSQESQQHQQHQLQPNDNALIGNNSDVLLSPASGTQQEAMLENLNIDFETMLMSEENGGGGGGVNNPSNSNTNSSNGGTALISAAHRNSNNMGSANVNQLQAASREPLSPTSEYGRQVQPSYRDHLYMLYDDSHRQRVEENIYEEVDFMTLTSLRAQYADTLSLQSWKKKGSKKTLSSGTSSSSSFTRWFSTRKKNSPTLSQDEENYVDVKSKKQRPPICLPEIPPPNLTQEQMKRRYIVGSIVDSENSYINSLHRLINEFKKPMEESSPPILSQKKINTIFYRVEQILQCHTIFGIALSQCAREWDEKERIGDVFINSFPKPMVLDIYSEFINNFTNAMETARKASKSKSAFAQFLQGKATSSPDRLSFFGLMVKPVQRFPQFILLLNDLLKHTPSDHPDRMSLQLALTQLEALADRLNERKRDSERHFAVEQLLKDYLSNSTTASSNRYLLRMDIVYILVLDSHTGLVLKTKCRKLYLLNDMLVCVSQPSNRLKFQAYLQDVDVIDDIKPATDNLLASSVLRTKDSTPASSPQHCTIGKMYQELNNLMHDLELMSRVKSLVTSLRYEYQGLSNELIEQLSTEIHNEIRRKDNQITLIDQSCLQLRVRSKNFKDTICIQLSDPEARKDWLTDVRLAKLALDRANNPAWDIVTESISSSSGNITAMVQQRVPLFVRSLPIFATTKNSQLTCALHYKLYHNIPGIDDPGSGVLWICNVNDNGSQLGALNTIESEMSLIHSYELCDSHVTCMELVANDLIWMGLKENRVIIVDANSPGEWRQIVALDVPGEVSCIKQLHQFVYVGLNTGVLYVFEIDRLEEPTVLELSQAPITCLLVIGKEMYACCHTKIWIIQGNAIEKSYSLVPESNVLSSSDSMNDNSAKDEQRPYLLAHCGIGLWVSLLNSSIIKLYHTETFKHLQDLNVAPNVKRVLTDAPMDVPIHVTSMLATRGLLWIGTSTGVIVTLTLPRLQGVPLVSGCLNVALHRHLGPVTILLSLTPGVTLPTVPNRSNNSRGDKSQGSTMDSKNDDQESIYGLYADLMKVGSYDEVKKPSGNLNAARMTWDLSNMTISDDSTSESASSSAIYQDGQSGQRSHGSASTIPSTMQLIGGSGQAQQGPTQQGQQAQQQGSAHTSPKEGHPSVIPGTMMTGGKHQIYPQQNLAQQQQQQQQQQQSRMAANSLYDSKRAKSATHGSEPNMANAPAALNQRNPNAYNANGSANPMANLKTALLMTGGNGYKRGCQDNSYSSQHAHCIIWEYKL